MILRNLPALGVASKIPTTMKCLDPDTENAVRDFLARIPADIRVDRAILFGSRARGEHRPGSDADVALILHERGDDGLTLMMLAELAYYLCDVRHRAGRAFACRGHPRQPAKNA
jgi:predicted nucleotidyltransferase